MAASAATVGAEQNVEFAFLTVGDRQPFSMLDRGQRGKEVLGQHRGVYAPERGTTVQISASQRLLAGVGPWRLVVPGRGPGRRCRPRCSGRSALCRRPVRNGGAR
jgi:hypothetical protein